MATELLFGIQTNDSACRGRWDAGYRHDVPKVKEASVHDYVDKTPDPHEIEEFEAASGSWTAGAPAAGSIRSGTTSLFSKEYKDRKTSRLAFA